MQKGKNGMRRVAALVCSVALFATLLPVQVLATDEGIQEPLTAVTLLDENGEETVSEQGDADNQQEEAVACTKDADCAAETHEEGCPKYVAPAEEEDTDPVVSCTKGEDCAAETHEEGCPKYVAPEGEEDTDPVVSCTKSEDCAAETHEESCPKYVVPEDNTPTEDNTVPEEPTDNNEKKTTPDEALLTVTPAEVTVSNETELREAIANAGTDATTITVNGTIELTSAIQVEGNKNLVLQGVDGSATITFAADLVVPSEEQAAKDFAMFQVANAANATITLKNIVLDGTGKARLILLGTYNTLFIEDGAVLQNGYAYKPESASNGNSGGAVRVLDYSKLIMNGGQIQNCQATRYAGGIYGWATGVTIEMNGGLIVNNEGGYAGGIVLLGNSNLYLKSGIITGNNGDGNQGGGVFVNGDTHCYLSGDIKIYGNRRTNISDTNVTYDIYINSNSNFVTLTGPFTGLVTICRLNDHLANTKREGLAYVCGTEDYQITAEDASRINILLANQALSLENNQLVVRASDQVVKVLFNANDGTSTPAVITRNMVKDTATTLPVNVFEREGYVFKGWNTAADGTGTSYSDGASVTLTESQTLYAQWMKVPELSVQMFGSTQLSVDGLTLQDLETTDTDILTINGTAASPAEDALGKTATVQATATEGVYTFPITLKVTVVPRALVYVDKVGYPNPGSITYNYSEGHHALSDSMTITWADAPQTEVTLTEGTDINYTYTVVDPEAPDGGKPLTYDYLPMPVGEYDVSFNLKNPNYTFALSDGATGNTLKVQVNVTAEGTQRAYLASAAPKADQNFVYNGQGVLPVEGTLNAYAKNDSSTSPVNIGTFTVNIEGLNGTSYHSEMSDIAAGTDLSGISGLKLPTEPGTYIITASAVNEDYYLYKSLVFTIKKATVTITAADKTVITGDSDGLPPLTSEDYTVTGLVGNDKLTTPPTLDYEYGANVDTVGTYDIIPSGAAANADRYTIQYVKGTLHVEKIAIIEGADQTWTQGSGSDLVIRSNADFSDFLRVEVNGNALVRDQNYTVRSGSTIVTIKAAYLDTLAAGDYTFAIVSKTGTASTHFTVKAKAAGESGASGNTGAATATPAPSGSSITYYTCPACGYHDWTAGADGYQCNHCGYVESVKQLSGYGNVTGVYEPNGGNVPQTAPVAAIPQTGDNSQPLVWVALVGISGAALAALAVFRRKRSDK